MTRFVVVFAAIILCGCAFPGATGCRSGLNSVTKAELFFGRSIASGGEVSEAEWQRFTAEEITPRFPEGLTMEDAQGHWNGKAGPVQEPSKHMMIVFSGDAEAKIEAIRRAYKSRFHQDSVLLVETAACASF